MRMSWLLCVSLGTLAWGQAVPNPPVSNPPAAPASPAMQVPVIQPSMAAPAAPAPTHPRLAPNDAPAPGPGKVLTSAQAATPAQAPGSAQAPQTAQPAAPAPAPGQAPSPQAPGAEAPKPTPPPEVPMNTVVLTIKGVCPALATPKAAPGKAGEAKGTESKTTAAAKKPAECKTELTRAQFEAIGKALSPSGITPQLKRQLEQSLPRFIAMSDIAKKKGLDKTDQYKQTLKVAQMQILTTQLARSVQEEADKIPPEKIEEYYKQNPEAFEQFSLDRLFIPRYKSVQPEEKEEKEPEKLTEEQQKAKEAEDKAKQEKGEQELTKLAESLRERAAAGEDIVKLQKEAFEAAGTKVDNPTVNLPKVRRTGLPPAHAAVFELKAGEVSQVISDNGGHYVYKVVSKEELPLDQVKDEIHNKMKAERQKEMMDKYTNSFQSIPNEAYFGPPAAPAAPPPRRGMMGRPMPPGAAPQGAPAPGAQGAPPQNAPAKPGPATNPPPSAPAANPPAQTPPPAAPPSKPN